MTVNPLLKQFYDDPNLKEAWAAFIIEELNQEALRRVYKGEDTAAIKEAKDVIAASFKRLNELFQPKKPKRPPVRAV